MAIQFRRGNEADLVAEQLLPAEPAFSLDKKRFLIGTGDGVAAVPTEAQVVSIATSLMSQRLPVGTILPWPANTAPPHALLLQGQLVNRADYPDLWQFAQNSGNLVPDSDWSNYKGSFSTGNGSTTFRLPDFRGLVPVGNDPSQNEFSILGRTGGSKTVTLTVDQIPSHHHRINNWALMWSTGGNTGTHTMSSGVQVNVHNDDVSYPRYNDYAGGGQPFSILQPYAVVNYIIIAKAETTHGDIESALAELISQTQAARDNANQAAEAASAAADAAHAAADEASAVAVGKKTPDGGEIFNSYTGSAANRATAPYSHAEGGGTNASGDFSHAEGGGTIASGDYSHAEGRVTTASGYASHAEGGYTTASGYYSHAGGYGTIASAKVQTAIGQYNAEDTNALFIVGNGTTSSSRSNAFTVKLDGSATVQTQGTSNNSVIIKSTLDTALAGKQSTSITDAGGYFTADTVEGALQEIGAQLSGLDEALEALL